MSCGMRNEGEINMTMLAMYCTTNSVSYDDDGDDGAACPADTLFEGILRRLTDVPSNNAECSTEDSSLFPTLFLSQALP